MTSGLINYEYASISDGVNHMRQINNNIRDQVGNLRKTDYDLMPIWKGQAMAQLRGSIKRKECACPMANATYANMLLHPPTVAKVMMDVVK